MTCGRAACRKTASLYPLTSTYFPPPSVSSSSAQRDVQAITDSYRKRRPLRKREGSVDRLKNEQDGYLFSSGSAGVVGCAGFGCSGCGVGAGVGAAGVSGLGAGVSAFGCSAGVGVGVGAAGCSGLAAA